MLLLLRAILLSITALMVFSCSSGEEAPLEEIPATAPASAPTEENASEKPEGVVDFQGSCQGAEALGELESYPLRLRAKENSLGIVRVRSDGKFLVSEQDNVLGEVPTGTLFYGQGPISSPKYGKSKAYRVALRDSEGRLCRGYVSTRVVEFEGRVNQ